MREILAWVLAAWVIAFFMFPEQTGHDFGAKAASFMKGWNSAQPPVTVPRVTCKES